jgi:CHAT domain-containing protein
VLSACETGLGEITGDGVFGLQRGFKKAGAQSIMMSLWKVDDEATQMLMTQFYTNLTSGKSKRQSLLDAQRYLREYEDLSAPDGPKRHPYSDPRYWAAFILLDAID